MSFIVGFLPQRLPSPVGSSPSGGRIGFDDPHCGAVLLIKVGSQDGRLLHCGKGTCSMDHF